eukprot:31533_1
MGNSICCDCDKNDHEQHLLSHLQSQTLSSKHKFEKQLPSYHTATTKVAEPNDNYNQQLHSLYLLQLTSIRDEYAQFDEYKECDLLYCKHFKDFMNATQQNQNDNNDIDIQKTLIAFHHLLQNHEHQFELIYDKIVEQVLGGTNTCDLRQCLMLRRNHRDRFQLQKNDQELRKLYQVCDNPDVKDIVTQQILDKIHCHFLHSFDIGYKLSTQDKVAIIQAVDASLTKNENNHIDEDFSDDKIVQSYHKIIADKKASYRNIPVLDRLNNENNKFVTTLNNDTPTTYSFGYRFFYWIYYKDNCEFVDPVRYKGDGSLWSLRMDIAVEQSNEGHTLGEFFVTAKFKNLKEELIDNPICGISALQWHILVEKANTHLLTDYIKSHVSESVDEKASDSEPWRKANLECYDDILPGTQITNSHLVAMMVYCNQDELQKHFSQTFRKKDNNESIESLKSRHSNYAHLGRLLRECVECFPSPIISCIN